MPRYYDTYGFPPSIAHEGPSRRGNVRCAARNRHGERCKHWATPGYHECTHHLPGTACPGGRGWVKRMLYAFKNATLQEQFERFAKDPDRLELNEELALARTCLAGLIERVNKEKDVSALSAEASATLLTLAKEVASIVESIARVQRELKSTITVEQLQQVVSQAAEIILEFVPPERAEDVTVRLGQLLLPAGLTRGELRSAMCSVRDRFSSTAKQRLEEQEIAKDPAADAATPPGGEEKEL